MKQEARVGAMRPRSHLSLEFESGVEVTVDLGKVEMTGEQARIVDKLVREIGNVPVPECTGDRCPAEEVLEPDEFELVRDLRATIGGTTGGAASGPIVDFCLNVINVHEG